MEAKTIADYMTSFPHHVSPDNSVVGAQRLMRRHNIRHLPVLDKGNLVGIVSQRDMYFLQTLTDASPDSVLVSEAMSEDVFAVFPSQSLGYVTRTMADSRIGSAVVMEGPKVVGIFTTVDALRALADYANPEPEPASATGG